MMPIVGNPTDEDAVVTVTFRGGKGGWIRGGSQGGERSRSTRSRSMSKGGVTHREHLMFRKQQKFVFSGHVWKKYLTFAKKYTTKNIVKRINNYI